MLYRYIYIYKYNSQKVSICSLWTVCPCYNGKPPRLSRILISTQFSGAGDDRKLGPAGGALRYI